jgi:hypothetical protein
MSQGFAVCERFDPQAYHGVRIRPASVGHDGVIQAILNGSIDRAGLANRCDIEWFAASLPYGHSCRWPIG